MITLKLNKKRKAQKPKPEVKKKAQKPAEPKTRWVMSNDPKLEKFLAKLNAELKASDCIHRVAVTVTMPEAIKHLKKGLEEHQTQAKLLHDAIMKMRKYAKRS